jgi:hypothetical protein
LTLRKEGRLEGLRYFLSKVWKNACDQNKPFDEKNAIYLAEELGEKVREAEEEWNKINDDLLKMMGTSSIPPLLAAGPLIATGHADFLAAAATVATGIPLIWGRRQTRAFPKKFPASFFMQLD